mmetsp:Transcript_4753/g.14526  ORF Transcript_4753/g.14526 Transcript_4753/m.14526 type:complete len:227 (+) Transcript_4753:335-1015(+)
MSIRKRRKVEERQSSGGIGEEGRLQLSELAVGGEVGDGRAGRGEEGPVLQHRLERGEDVGEPARAVRRACVDGGSQARALRHPLRNVRPHERADDARRGWPERPDRPRQRLEDPRPLLRLARVEVVPAVRISEVGEDRRALAHRKVAVLEDRNGASRVERLELIRGRVLWRDGGLQRERQALDFGGPQYRPEGLRDGNAVKDELRHWGRLTDRLRQPPSPASPAPS